MSGTGISFKIAAPPRPSSSAAPSRPSANGKRSQHHQRDDESDSDDEDGLASKSRRRAKDELVTGFDSEGLTKKHKEAKAAPLVIPSLPNKDWRAAASEAGARRSNKGKKREMYIPDAVGGMRVGGPAAPVDGSQGGMGTRDVINSTPVVGGLALGAPKPKPAEGGGAEAMEVDVVEEKVVVDEKVLEPQAETEEQRALRELMSGGASSEQAPSVSVIQSAADARGVLGEAVDTTASTFLTDVYSRPDEASLDDYARVPVGEFGAAMLRGMGWKPGQAASRTGRKGPVEAFVPKARPSMLGIGAKPMGEVLGPDEKGKGGGAGPKMSRREEMKFMPLVKKEREGSAGDGSGRSTPAITASGMSSRLPSVSPPSRSSSSRPVAADSFPDASSSSRRDDDRRRDDYSSSSSRRRDDYHSSSKRDDRERDRDRDSSSRREREHDYRSSSKRDRDGGSYRDSRDSGRDGGRERERRRSRSPRREGRDRDRDSGRERREDGRRR